MTVRKRPRNGFTLVELLTVIAIIAILAAIIFPVFSIVRKNVHKAQCTSNLHSLAQAIKMYKDDYRVYPDALYGYGFPNGGGQTFLYPNYIKDRVGFRCPLAPERSIDTTPDKLVTGVDVLNDARSQYSRSGLRYFRWDSYDGSLIPHNSANARYVIHYLRKTTAGSGAGDNPRQLIYKNPPDNTVVTWCTYHRNYQGNEPETGSVDLVLFLDGRVKPMQTTQTAREDRAHAVTPGG